MHHAGSSTPFRFESLHIWHRARHFSSSVHRITADFPHSELYALTSQMNRAADAAVLLIDEGSGLESRSVFLHRLGLSTGEIVETAAGSFLALDRGYVSAEAHADLYRQAATLAPRCRFKQTLR